MVHARYRTSFQHDCTEKKETPSYHHQFNVGLKRYFFFGRQKYLPQQKTRKNWQPKHSKIEKRRWNIKGKKWKNIEHIRIDRRREDPLQHIREIEWYIYATSHFPNFIITTDASRLYCSRLLGLCSAFVRFTLFFTISPPFHSWHDQNGKFHLAASHIYYLFSLLLSHSRSNATLFSRIYWLAHTER